MSLAALNARAVADATARKLSWLAYGYGPALRPSSFEYGVVPWDLEFVLQHIHAIQQLLSHPQADSGPDWLPAISPVVAHAFDSIRTILENLDMKAADRNLREESCPYGFILYNVEEISKGRCGSSLITSELVKLFEDMFLRLVGSSHYPYPDVVKCISILMNMHHQLPEAYADIQGADTHLMELFTFSNVTMVGYSRTYQAGEYLCAFPHDAVRSTECPRSRQRNR